jgi:ABC-type multidrug transport system fused ATPase/permease subunit
MDISNAMALCLRNQIKIYPSKGYIFVERTGKQTIKYNKRLTSSKEINEAVTKTYIYYAKKLMLKVSKVKELL